MDINQLYNDIRENLTQQTFNYIKQPNSYSLDHTCIIALIESDKRLLSNVSTWHYIEMFLTVFKMENACVKTKLDHKMRLDQTI